MKSTAYKLEKLAAKRAWDRYEFATRDDPRVSGAEFHADTLRRMAELRRIKAPQR